MTVKKEGPEGAISRGCDVKVGVLVKTKKGHNKVGLTESQCKKLPAGEWLGSGTYAEAYVHKNDPNKVVKFTGDPADAQVSERLKGKRLLGAINVYDVYRLKGQTGVAELLYTYNPVVEQRNVEVPLYGIVSERVAPLTQNVHLKAVDAFLGMGGNTGGNLDPQTVTPEKILQNTPKARKGKSPEQVLGEAVQDCEDETKPTQRHLCRPLLSGMLNAVAEVGAATGSVPTDLHVGNWGVRDSGEVVILDFGAAAVDEAPKSIEELAGVRKLRQEKRKNMDHKRPRKAPRPKTYDYTLGAFEIPNAKAAGSFASSLLPRALAIGGLGALAYWFFFSAKAAAKENVKSAALPTGSETGGSVTTDRGVKPAAFVDPGSNTAVAGPADPIVLSNDRHIVKAGESWSNIASRVYGDYRWWPALWDANRASGRFGNPGTLAVGDVIVVPKLPVQSERFKKLVFDRAELDRKWELKKRTKGAKAAGPRPKSTFTATPVLATDVTAVPVPMSPAPSQQPALPAAPVKEVDYVTSGELSQTEGGYEDLSS